MNSDSNSNPKPGSLTDGTAELQARPAFRPSADWTSYLRPVNAPVPDWYKPQPPADKPKPPPAPSSGETSTSSTGGSTHTGPTSGETSPISPISSGGYVHAAAASGETSATSTSSAGGCTREHPIPEDSILADYRDFVRKVSELPDGLILAPILSLCGRLLTPAVTLDFGGSKPLTMYNFIATPAGLRKSTTFKPAEKIAQKILMSSDLLYGNASDSALFDSFEQQPHRMQFEDEGNTLLRTWETSAHGKEVSARYLKLYDGAPWTQNYLRERKLHEGGSSERHIPQATLSLCIGATYGVARLDNLEAGSGLRRRFGFYLASQQAREIWWPRSLEGAALDELAEQFRKLSDLQGVVGANSFTQEAREYWISLQKRNRERCKQIPGYTSGEESLLSSLNESPARCLKLAVIFQACRWARGSIENPYLITQDVLALAEAHQDACLDALVELEAQSRRVLVADTGEWLMSQISGDHPGQRSADYTRTELTRRFAANPGRQGALTVSRLYGEILPQLVKQGHCRIRSKVGRCTTYTFTWD
ncbi:MAG: DUF3987 domain-containing protein [Prosthecobacter sp.]|uniref:DUF3987 domain-containing protein n=1 Tax=Prosthecobacter sp. TaxID=1965333 RepID=UPI003BAF43D7